MAGREPAVIHASHGWDRATRSLRQRWAVDVRTTIPRVTCVVDPMLRTHPIVHKVGEWVADLGAHLDLVDDRPCPTTHELAGWGRRLADADVTLAVGGGTVLDRAKLATVLASNPAAVQQFDHVGRCGVVLLPDLGCTRTTPLVAVPTTIGTGAEAAPLAVWDDGRRRRLISGVGLRPERSIHDTFATSSMPLEVLLGGGVEILLRLAGPYLATGQPPSVPQDPMVDALVAQLLDAVHVSMTTPHAVPVAALDTLAMVSAMSHAEGLAREGLPLSVLWMIANECAAHLGVPKMTAVAGLVAPSWRRALAGDHRFGDAHRLRRLWTTVQAAWPDDLPDDPAEGFDRLVAATGLRDHLPLTDADVDVVTARILHAWGAGLPLLQDLRSPDIRGLLEDALCPRPSAKEVKV